MSREIPAVVNSWSSEVMNRPVELYQAFLDTEILRFAQSDVDMQFGGQTWWAMGISRGEIRTSTELECDEVQVSIDNVNLAMADRIIATDFIGRRLAIYKVQRGNVSSGQAMVLFDGRMDEPVLDQSKLVVAVRSWLDGMHVSVPRRIFSSICNYQLYDQWCSVVKSTYLFVTSAAPGAPVASGTHTGNIGTGTALDSSTTYTLVASFLAQQSPGYFGPIGTLTMKTGSNANIGREVMDHAPSSISVEVRIPFPFMINSGDEFSIERACTKTVADCCSKFGNYLNYGGFPTIPRAGLQIDMPSVGTGGGGKK